MIKTEILSWWSFPLSMRCPSSLLINFAWKSVLLDIRMTTSDCFLGPFAISLAQNCHVLNVSSIQQKSEKNCKPYSGFFLSKAFFCQSILEGLGIPTHRHSLEWGLHLKKNLLIFFFLNARKCRLLAASGTQIGGKKYLSYLHWFSFLLFLKTVWGLRGLTDFF